MSDMGTQERRQFSAEEKLQVTFHRLKITSIFFCIGWLIFAIFLIGISYTKASGIAPLFVLIGWAVVGLPMIGRMWIGGFKHAFNLPEYEVITTYSDGRKTTDHGAQSQMNNLFVQIFLALALIALGGIVTILYLVFLTIKYLAQYAMVKPKHSFMQSGLFFVALNVAVFIVAIFIGIGIQHGGTAQLIRDSNAQQAVLGSLEVGKTAAIAIDNCRLYVNGDITKGTIKTLMKGDIVTIVDKDTGFYMMWQVEHNGDIGFVNEGYLGPNK